MHREMTSQQARGFIKNRLVDFLISQNINLRRPFRCLNQEHIDNNPSMNYDRRRNKVHCFGCGADYDTFDVIKTVFSLDNFHQAFSKACSLYDISIVANTKIDLRKKTQRQNDNDIQTTLSDKQMVDYTGYYLECARHIGETDYLLNRGLSFSTMTRFNIGFDKHFKIGNRAEWRAIIIPTDISSFVVRNTDKNATDSYRYRKVGPIHMFNAAAIEKADKPIFIVEGEIDALSIVEAGGEAIALGSTACIRKLLKFLEIVKPQKKLILFLDNDESGKKSTNELSKGLYRLEIDHKVIADRIAYKDANQALVNDKNSLSDLIKQSDMA